jgi:hypothetical protein
MIGGVCWVPVLFNRWEIVSIVESREIVVSSDAIVARFSQLRATCGGWPAKPQAEENALTDCDFLSLNEMK